ncbi:hypothetical protein MP228_011584 [Amoeboaphelidium protococcarum]|nr:hypothetical protein MP228_011584 [Amoeboaphelidium protococcarum]
MFFARRPPQDAYQYKANINGRQETLQCGVRPDNVRSNAHQLLFTPTSAFSRFTFCPTGTQVFRNLYGGDSDSIDLRDLIDNGFDPRDAYQYEQLWIDLMQRIHDSSSPSMYNQFPVATQTIATALFSAYDPYPIIMQDLVHLQKNVLKALSVRKTCFIMKNVRVVSEVQGNIGFDYDNDGKILRKYHSGTWHHVDGKLAVIKVQTYPNSEKVKIGKEPSKYSNGLDEVSIGFHINDLVDNQKLYTMPSADGKSVSVRYVGFVKTLDFVFGINNVVGVFLKIFQEQMESLIKQSIDDQKDIDYKKVVEQIKKFQQDVSNFKNSHPAKLFIVTEQLSPNSNGLLLQSYLNRMGDLEMRSLEEFSISADRWLRYHFLDMPAAVLLQVLSSLFYASNKLQFLHGDMTSFNIMLVTSDADQQKLTSLILNFDYSEDLGGMTGMMESLRVNIGRGRQDVHGRAFEGVHNPLPQQEAFEVEEEPVFVPKEDGKKSSQKRITSFMNSDNEVSNVNTQPFLSKFARKLLQSGSSSSRGGSSGSAGGSGAAGSSNSYSAPNVNLQQRISKKFLVHPWKSRFYEPIIIDFGRSSIVRQQKFSPSQTHTERIGKFFKKDNVHALSDLRYLGMSMLRDSNFDQVMTNFEKLTENSKVPTGEQSWFKRLRDYYNVLVMMVGIEYMTPEMQQQLHDTISAIKSHFVKTQEVGTHPDKWPLWYKRLKLYMANDMDLLILNFVFHYREDGDKDLNEIKKGFNTLVYNSCFSDPCPNCKSTDQHIMDILEMPFFEKQRIRGNDDQV